MGRIVIIGGGAIGLSLAYHLTGRGEADVLLLERNQLTSGTSWHAAGIVGPLRATPNMTRLAMYALDLFPRLEKETGLATGYRRTGGYWLARKPERMDELHRIAALGQYFGLAAQVVSASDIMVPGLDLSDHVGALSVPEDANVNPVDLCMAYARAARALGAVIRENAAVRRIIVSDRTTRGVEMTDGTVIQADQVVICAGAWSEPLAASAGLELPLQAVEHMYIVTEQMPDLPVPYPVIRDLDTGIYIKGDAGKLVIGGFEPDAKCWDAFGPQGTRPFLELPEDWDQFTPFMQAALRLMPDLEHTGIQHFMNGPESFTSDTRPLVGAAPGVDGLYVAAGMNSVGIMSSAGIGRVLADWMVDKAPPMDLWEVDIARADPATASFSHMAARMTEAVSDLFALHWPYKQPGAGRDLRNSVLHDRWAAQGAVFGLTAGWERGLWYARKETERSLPYSVGAQPWWPIAAREAAVLDHGTALLDLSPFTKILITGPDAIAGLNKLACRTITADPNNVKCLFTPLLNDRGGIEVDCTVTTLDADKLRLTTPAATRWRDLAYLRRSLAGYDVTIIDQTEDMAVIGVMGAGARETLKTLSNDDWHDFPFATAREVTISGHKVWAKRLSFVGEMGWELWLHTNPAQPARDIFDGLVSSGAQPMGHLALEGCRLEKGFRHWGHDLGPEITPIQAGLEFTIDWTKDFVGKPALERQRKAGASHRLTLFAVPGDPLLLHDEPIRENGKIIGLTTSGGLGPRTGLSLAFGLISVAPGETPEQTISRNFEILVAGKSYSAQALKQPPFDPKGERMRQ